MADKTISRRDFLKFGAAVAGGMGALILGGCEDKAPTDVPEKTPTKMPPTETGEVVTQLPDPNPEIIKETRAQEGEGLLAMLERTYGGHVVDAGAIRHFQDESNTTLFYFKNKHAMEIYESLGIPLPKIQVGEKAQFGKVSDVEEWAGVLKNAVQDLGPKYAFVSLEVLQPDEYDSTAGRYKTTLQVRGGDFGEEGQKFSCYK